MCIVNLGYGYEQFQSGYLYRYYAVNYNREYLSQPMIIV